MKKKVKNCLIRIILFGIVLFFILGSENFFGIEKNSIEAQNITTIVFQQGISGYKGCKMVEIFPETWRNTKSNVGFGSKISGGPILLFFDLSSIPSNAIIDEVKLEIFVERVYKSGDVTIFRINNPDNLGTKYLANWYEPTESGTNVGACFAYRDSREGYKIPWSNIDNGELSTVLDLDAEKYITTETRNTWISLSSDKMKATVQGWINGSLPNNGWYIKFPQIRYRSKWFDNPCYRPRLFITFHNATLPLIINSKIIDLTFSKAMIKWTTNMLIEETQLEYGLNSEYGYIETPVKKYDKYIFVATIGELKPSTTYHYRIKVENSNGVWIASNDATFTTLPISDSQLTGLFSNKEPILQPNFSLPNYKESYLDPVFKTKIINIAPPPDLTSEGKLVTFMVPDYSRQCAWNADGSKLLLLGPGCWWHLFDGNTYEYIKGGPEGLRKIPCGEIRWSNTNPDILYHIWGNSLYKYNVSTNELTLLHRWSEYSKVTHGDEGTLSADDRYIALMGYDLEGNFQDIFVYDLFTNNTIKFHASQYTDRTPNWVTISPSGKYVIVQWNPPSGSERYYGVEVYDRETMNFLHQLCQGYAHGDVGIDIDGSDIYVTNDPPPNYENLVKIRISDGSKTVILNKPAGHISLRNYKFPGWVLVSNYVYFGHSNEPSFGLDEIYAVKLDGSGEVRRIAHHHSCRGNDYWAEPHATVNRDFTKIAFGTNWAGIDYDNNSCGVPCGKHLTFVVELVGEFFGIVTNNLFNGKVGQFFSQTLQAIGGNPPYTWTATDSLPNGLSLDSSTGIISGTPTQAGTFTFTIQVKDSNNNTSTKEFTLTINPAQLIGDLNQDNKVNSQDFQILIQKFKETQNIEIEDLNSDGIVDVKDIGILMHYWTN